ncbi:MAG: hypothetical protein ACK4QW_17855 [Alphaproteobacteria bacterium]
MLPTLRATVLGLALALLASCTFYQRPLPPGTVQGSERVAVAIAIPDQANFVRMGLTRFGNVDYKVPAEDWGLREIAKEAAFAYIRERHPAMTVVEIRSDFPREDFYTIRDGFGVGSEPTKVLPREVGGYLAEFVRATPADFVVIVAAVYSALPDSNPSVANVRADGFGIFSRWVPLDVPWISPFAAIEVAVIKKPDLVRLAGKQVTVCDVPTCVDRDPGERWRAFARRYESWEAVQTPEKRDLVKSDVREAVAHGVRKGLTAVGL